MSRVIPILFCTIITIFLVTSCGDDTSSPENGGSGPMNVSGVWHGTWTSTDEGSNGPFMVVFDQNGSTLSGSVDIPDINFHDAPLTGTVNQDHFTFGDVDGVIQFTGTINSDTTSASGQYEYPALDDEGTWTMTRGSGSFITLTDSLDLPSTYFGSDIVWADSRIWILAPSDQIHIVDPATGILDSVTTPGSYPSGIAYDGIHLFVSDGPWGTSKMYLVDPVVPSILMSPGDGSIDGLASDGSHIWCLDDDPFDPCIYQLNASGGTIGSFSCLGSSVKGLTYDGTDLWYGSFESGETSIYRVDTNGTLLSSFGAPSFMPGGLTFDGESLWLSSGWDDPIYQLSTDGTVLSSFSPPDDQGQDLAWDGTHLWFACGDISPGQNLIYCMDRSGSVVSSIECPGNSPGGLTYDGSHLWSADNQTKRIYRLDTDGGNFFPLPPFEFQYLTYDGTQFWADVSYENRISRFDDTGTVTASFDSPCEDIGGLTWMNGSLWIFGKEWFALSSIYQMNADGVILAQYDSFGELPEPFGVANDGDSLWYLGRVGIGVSFKLYTVELPH